MLARNADTDSAVRSVRELEDKFNSKYKYPWVFLNEEPFSDDFKNRVANVASGPVEFGVIPREHWYQPEWIDEEKAKAGRDKMVQDNIIYGGASCVGCMCGGASLTFLQAAFRIAICVASIQGYVFGSPDHPQRA